MFYAVRIGVCCCIAIRFFASLFVEYGLSYQSLLSDATMTVSPIGGSDDGRECIGPSTRMARILNHIL